MAFYFRAPPEFYRSSALPPICVVTGRTENLIQKPFRIILNKNTWWNHPKETIHLPFAPEAIRQYRLAQFLIGFGLIVAAAWFASVALFSGVQNGVWPFLGFLVVAAYFAAVVSWELSRVPRILPKSPNGTDLVIRFPSRAESISRAYCAAFMQWKQANNIKTDITYNLDLL